jgi:hypothetical protein
MNDKHSALPIKAGDPFPLDEADVGDCPGVYSTDVFRALCVLDSGHRGPHVATDGLKVVEVWV